MTNPNVKVSAYIPHVDGEKVVIETGSGDLPSMQYTADAHETYEGTLRAIVRDVTGSHGKIESRLPSREVAQEHIVYKTSPLGEVALESTKYQWGSLPETA